MKSPALSTIIGALLLTPATALAGMPQFMFTDLAQMRLSTISFFLVVIAVVGFGVQRLWNRLGLDFPRLPRLSYRGALAFVVLWGLVFHLILVMISGARELMTPGAWERDGATYKLRQVRPASQADQLHLARRQQLDRLRAALWQYAEQNEGRFPPDDYASGIPEAVWMVLDPSQLHYVYVSGSRTDGPKTPLSFEPGIYGRDRYVLYTTGEIELQTVEQIYDAIPEATS